MRQFWSSETTGPFRCVETQITKHSFVMKKIILTQGVKFLKALCILLTTISKTLLGPGLICDSFRSHNFYAVPYKVCEFQIELYELAFGIYTPSVGCYSHVCYEGWQRVCGFPMETPYTWLGKTSSATSN